MGRFTHLLVLTTLMFWLAGAGCVGNEASEIEDSEMDSSPVKEGQRESSEESAEYTAGELELNETEILELEADIAELEALLENASLEEDIVIEEL